jgi:aminopeptidase C
MLYFSNLRLLLVEKYKKTNYFFEKIIAEKLQIYISKSLSI